MGMLQYSYITLLLKRQNLTLSACYIPLIPFFHIILLLEYWDMLLSGYSIVPSRKRLTTFLLIDSKGCLLFNIFVKQVVLFFIFLLIDSKGCLLFNIFVKQVVLFFIYP